MRAECQHHRSEKASSVHCSDVLQRALQALRLCIVRCLCNSHEMLHESLVLASISVRPLHGNQFCKLERHLLQSCYFTLWLIIIDLPSLTLGFLGRLCLVRSSILMAVPPTQYRLKLCILGLMIQVDRGFGSTCMESMLQRWNLCTCFSTHLVFWEALCRLGPLHEQH